MKKVSILLGILTVLGATAASAAGNNLSWNDCTASGADVQNRTDTCTNAGLRNLIASFVSPTAIGDLGGCQWGMDLQSNAATLDAWWKGDVNGVFANRWAYLPSNPSGALCEAEVWSSAALINVPATFQQKTPGRIQINGSQAFIAPAVGSVAPGPNYYNFTLQLKYTSGTLNNAGCLSSACIVLNTCDLQSAVNHVLVEGPATQNFVTWRLSAGVPCPQGTPTQKSTWGSIKAIYR